MMENREKDINRMAENREKGTGLNQDYANAWYRAFDIAEKKDNPGVEKKLAELSPLLRYADYLKEREGEKDEPGFAEKTMEASDPEKVRQLNFLADVFNLVLGYIKKNKDLDLLGHLTERAHKLLYEKSYQLDKEMYVTAGDYWNAWFTMESAVALGKIKTLEPVKHFENYLSGKYPDWASLNKRGNIKKFLASGLVRELDWMVDLLNKSLDYIKDNGDEKLFQKIFDEARYLTYERNRKYKSA